MFHAQIFPGSNITLVKTHNLRAVLLCLLHEGHVSRVELAEATGLSTTTITNLIAELLEQGIVIEEGQTRTHTRRHVGRPRTALHLVPDARYAIGVHIGIGLYRVAVTNLYAEILHNVIQHYPADSNPDDVLVSIANTIEEVIRASNVNRQRIIGLGVGAPGLIDYERGVILVAPNLNWRNVPVRDFLEDQLGQLVVVDNNVRAMALGEAFFGSGRGANSLAFVYGRVGVGAGFVVNGQVFRGSNAGAGEIGHTVMLAQGGELCGCGNRGCLETLVSETALLREASLCARDHPDSLLAGYLTQASDVPPVDLIFRAAREGDPYSAEMIKQRAGYLGLALANLVNVFNPELILLGGMFSQGEDLFLPEATATMRKNAFAGLGEKVRLQTTSFGWRAGVIGAAALALTTNFYQQTG